MKIEKSMYIRFNGFISKIEYVNTSKKENKYIQFKAPNGMLASTREENIKKASFNIIDLIEVGDYVNGKRVDYISEGKLIYYEKTDCGVDMFYIELPIKNIVTKKQFEKCSYKVGD